MCRHGNNHRCVSLITSPQSTLCSATTELAHPAGIDLGFHLDLALESHFRLDIQSPRRKGAKKIVHVANKKRNLDAMSFCHRIRASHLDARIQVVSTDAFYDGGHEKPVHRLDIQEQTNLFIHSYKKDHNFQRARFQTPTLPPTSHTSVPESRIPFSMRPSTILTIKSLGTQFQKSP